MKNRHKTVGNIFLIAGAIALIACGVLFALNRHEDSRAGKYSSDLTKTSKSIAIPSEEVPIKESDPLPVEETSVSIREDLLVVDVDGYPCCGILSIPAIELEMAVLDTWNDDYLKHSVCRYYGSPYTNDLVIAGHNYRSGFGKLTELETGDEIYFTDMEGNVVAYRVADVEVLQGTAVTEMVESEWDLSLYTCTNGGSARYTVRAERFGEG